MLLLKVLPVVIPLIVRLMFRKNFTCCNSEAVPRAAGLPGTARLTFGDQVSVTRWPFHDHQEGSSPSPVFM